MRNISSEDMGAIMDFLYLGEANLREESLESFLKIATDLQIKGLTIETQRFSSKPQPTEDQKKINIEVSPTEPKIKFDHIKEEPDIKYDEGDKKDFTFEAIDPIPNDNDALAADIEEQIENMMERSANKIQNGKEKQIHCSICKICGKEARRSVIRRHIRTEHFLFSEICNLCGMKFRSEAGRQKHKTNNPYCKKQEEHEKSMYSLVGKSENLIRNEKHRVGREKMIFQSMCKLCGKEGRLSNIRDHIEVKHLGALSIPCNTCGKTFQWRSAPRMHCRDSVAWSSCFECHK